jgi:hypothetical protein
MIHVIINFISEQENNYVFICEAIDVICQFLINISILYFILEMYLIKIKLVSETYRENFVKTKRAINVRRIACGYQLVTGSFLVVNILLL